MVAMTMKNFLVQNDHDFCKNAHFQMVIHCTTLICKGKFWKCGEKVALFLLTSDMSNLIGRDLSLSRGMS